MFFNVVNTAIVSLLSNLFRWTEAHEFSKLLYTKVLQLHQALGMLLINNRSFVNKSHAQFVWLSPRRHVSKHCLVEPLNLAEEMMAMSLHIRVKPFQRQLSCLLAEV